MKTITWLLSGGALLAVAVLAAPSRRADGVEVSPTIDSTCATSATPFTVNATSSPTLNAFTAAGLAGTTYDTTGNDLTLVKPGGALDKLTPAASGDVLTGCSGDFNGDGWTDFVATGPAGLLGSSALTLFVNKSGANTPPDWNNASATLTPTFTASTVLDPGGLLYGSAQVACGDVNGDGKMDVLYLRCTGLSSSCTPASRAQIFLGKGDGTFQTPYTFMSSGSLAKLGTLSGSSTPIAFSDYNGDGKLDIILGTTTGSGGSLVVQLNDGGASPKFDTQVALVTGIGYGAKGPAALAVADFNGDGVADYLVGGPSTTSVRLYPGALGGGVGAYQDLTSFFGGGNAVAVLGKDLDGDGRADLVVGTSTGQAYYLKNNRSSTPFSDDNAQVLIPNGSTALVNAWALDYDHDPSATADFVVDDGNGNWYLYANRTSQAYVSCGTVTSNVINAATSSSSDVTVSAVRVTPTPSAPSSSLGTTTWETSNDGGVSWHPATVCGDDVNSYCTAYQTTIGTQVRWRATMCAGGVSHLTTPTLSAVSTSYTTVAGSNHYRAGPIAGDGIIYVGSFAEPGDSGHVFAVDDSCTSGGGCTKWDAAALLDTTPQASRNVYVGTLAQNPLLCSDLLQLPTCRLDFTHDTLNNLVFGLLLQTTLLTLGPSAGDLIDWWYSARFGLTTPHVMGGVVNSTPALLTHPALPPWYNYSSTSSAMRTSITAYDAQYATRPQMIFTGAEDGALHAFLTNPADASDPTNGKEAWAYIPVDVAARLNADRLAGTITAYPDGSPSLANVTMLGQWRTILVSGEGNGGRTVYAIDVTDTVTVDPSTHAISTAGKGPIPLWTYTDVLHMGLTFSKPAIIRTHLGYMAVFASGRDPYGNLGQSVYAINMDTGLPVWIFTIPDTDCYIATDITAADAENSDNVDGYTDRIYFGDNKGRIWKLDPNNFLTNDLGGVINTVDSLVDLGIGSKALFSTRLTAGALGADRAIAGTMTAAYDSTKRLVLYFGTGGTEDSPAGAQNAFYAVYADTGEIRSKLDQSSGIAAGIKFYGGVVYQDGQLIFTDGQDLSGLGLCSPSAGNIVAIDANTFAVQFQTSTGSKIVAPMYAVNGEIYTVTMTGALMTSQYSGAVTVSSGGSSGSSGGGASGSGSSGSGSGSSTTASSSGTESTPFTMVGWRQLQ